MNRIEYLNVTVLMDPTGRTAIRDLCSGKASFATIITPITTIYQPSNRPSGSPTMMPTNLPTVAMHSSLTSGFMGFISIILLISLLRFHPVVTAMLSAKKEPKEGHLYDILVVLNENEEAIIENIRHEDIAFFRRTYVESDDQSLVWMMNATADLLEKRFEVQFFDHYDLLGQSGLDEKFGKTGHAVVGDKLITKEIYMHDAKLHMGMIIRVKVPLDDKDLQRNNSDDGSEFSMSIGSDLESVPDTPHKTKSSQGSVKKNSQKLSRIGITPMDYQQDDDESSDACFTSQSLVSFRALNRPGHNLDNEDYLKSARSYYDDGISDDDSESYITPRLSQKSGYEYGLKNEMYTADSDGEDSVDSTSIDLPLDNFSFSDSNPMYSKGSHRSNRSARMRLRAELAEERASDAEEDADDEIIRESKSSKSRRKSDFTVASKASNVSSISASSSDMTFSKPRSRGGSKKYTFRDDTVADVENMNLMEIILSRSQSQSAEDEIISATVKASKRSLSPKGRQSPKSSNMQTSNSNSNSKLPISQSGRSEQMESDWKNFTSSMIEGLVIDTSSTKKHQPKINSVKLIEYDSKSPISQSGRSEQMESDWKDYTLSIAEDIAKGMRDELECKPDEEDGDENCDDIFNNNYNDDDDKHDDDDDYESKSDDSVFCSTSDEEEKSDIERRNSSTSMQFEVEIPTEKKL